MQHYNIKELEQKVLAEKWATVIRTEVVNGNVYRRVNNSWLRYGDNKLELNDLWHSFIICDYSQQESNLWVIKNIRKDTITFNGVKKYTYFSKDENVRFVCIYNKWVEFEYTQLRSLIKRPGYYLRSMADHIKGVMDAQV